MFQIIINIIIIITNTVVNKHVKIKEIRVKEKFNPWMTNEIIALIYKRDYTNHMAVRLASSDKINEYKKLYTNPWEKIKKKFHNIRSVTR